MQVCAHNLFTFLQKLKEIWKVFLWNYGPFSYWAWNLLGQLGSHYAGSPAVQRLCSMVRERSYPGLDGGQERHNIGSLEVSMPRHQPHNAVLSGLQV